MRTVFLGTSDYAATVLRRLARSPHRPQLVVTPPDRRRGRGRRLAPQPAAVAASELGIELLRAASVNEPEATARVLAAAPQIGVVCAFGQLIKEPLLSELELLNVHPSLLPRWRGAAPIERSLMAGDRETGVTIMRLTAGLDSGPIALQESVAIADGESAGSLRERLAELGGELLVRALELRAAGELRFRDQDDREATYAEKIEPAERRLDPARSAVELERTVRGLTPHVGAYLELDDGARLAVVAATAASAADGAAPEAPLGEAGAIVERDGELWLVCGEGGLRLDTVQPPGRRPMAADAYLRGHAAPARAR